jgi:hypothetical protein
MGWENFVRCAKYFGGAHFPALLQKTYLWFEPPNFSERLQKSVYKNLSG